MGQIVSSQQNAEAGRGEAATSNPVPFATLSEKGRHMFTTTIQQRDKSAITNWDRIKADYHAACAAEAAASAAYGRADDDMFAFGRSAPTAEIEYLEDAYAVRHISIGEHLATFELTVANCRSDSVPEAIKQLEAYAAFIATADAWEETREKADSARGWSAAQQTWEEAFAKRRAAWVALIQCPAGTITEAAEKSRIARADSIDAEELNALLDAISADLSRLAE